ncbi:MAG: CPBP family intramembrane glutamic endopeptidase [Pseudomonadota bacterium]
MIGAAGRLIAGIRADFADPEAGPPLDRRTVIVLVASTLLLCLYYYLGTRSAYYGLGFNDMAARRAPELHSAHGGLLAYAYWGVMSFVFRVAAPALLIVWVLRERLADFGFGLGRTGRHIWRYAALYAFMLPLLIAASSTAGFQATYPFYKPALQGGGLFWTYEAVYLLQFFGVETFFRGFLLFGLYKRFGYYAIFIMTIPYAMIHFGKPAGETFGAIIAGYALGYLALKTRSVAPGVFLHCGVAFSMDVIMLMRAHGGLAGGLLALF